MEVSNQIKLHFLGVSFPNVVFNAKQQVNPQNQHEVVVNTNIQPKVFYPPTETKIFTIIMEVKVTSDKFFELFIVAIANFQFDNEVLDENTKKGFVNVNAPAIMFPYVRAFVTTLTSNLGTIMGSITIPPQFFSGDLPELKPEELKQGQEMVYESETT